MNAPPEPDPRTEKASSGEAEDRPAAGSPNGEPPEGEPRGQAPEGEPGEDKPRRAEPPKTSEEESGEEGADQGAQEPRKPREPDDPRDEPFHTRVAEDEKEWQQREESLRSLRLGGLGAYAGRDWVGQVSSEVSGGTMYHAHGNIVINDGDRRDQAVRIHYVLERDAEWLSDDHLAEVPSLPELRRTLEHKPLVFVRGAEDTGRKTAALAALLEWAGTTHRKSLTEDGRAPVGLVQVDGSPGRLGQSELREGHGYVLDAADHQGWSPRLDAETAYLEGAAVKRGCRLVVLVSEERPLPPGPVVAHRRPSALDVFERCLVREARDLGVDPALPSGAHDLVAKLLADEPSPRKAADHARWLASGLAEGRSAEDVLQEVPDRVHQEICKRLGERRPVLGRCFMASVAVLHGLAEGVVSRAALDLADRIDKVWRPDEKKRVPPTWEQLRSWLAYAGAAARPVGGPGDGRVVELRQLTTATETLRVLWEEQPTIRAPLMDWLRDLGEDGALDVQIKAAHAVGLLATFDFDSVEEEFLRPWSRSRRPAHHRLAAWALEVAAQHPALTGRVHRHLRALAKSTYVGERTVAIRAYGSSIGAGAPEAALNVFGTIAGRATFGLADAIAGSVAYLFSDATSARIIKALTGWANGETDGHRYTAAVTFLRLVAISEGVSGRTTLIELAEDDDVAAGLVPLWHHALALRFKREPPHRPRPVTPAAWAYLADWVARYDEAPAVRSVIDGVVGRTSRPGFEDLWLRDAFRLHLRLWRHRRQISAPVYERLARLAERPA